jgi:hypothetical protein
MIASWLTAALTYEITGDCGGVGISISISIRFLRNYLARVTDALCVASAYAHGRALAADASGMPRRGGQG